MGTGKTDCNSFWDLPLLPASYKRPSNGVQTVSTFQIAISFRTVASKLQPAGRMQLVKHFHPARGINADHLLGNLDVLTL